MVENLLPIDTEPLKASDTSGRLLNDVPMVSAESDAAIDTPLISKTITRAPLSALYLAIVSCTYARP